MKYHTTISTIIISVAVALMFASVGLFIITNLNMTSPTIIAANRLLKEIESVDSRLSVSFESMDRNFRDGVFINGFRIEYEKNEILYVRKLSINKGLFSLIRYFVSRNGLISLSADYASISVPEGLLSGSGAGRVSISTESQIAVRIPEILEKWGFLMDIYSLDIRIGDKLISDIKLSVDWPYGLNGSAVAIGIPYIEYSKDGFSLALSGLSMTLKADDGIKLFAASDSVSADNGLYSFNASDISLAAENEGIDFIDPERISLRAAMGSVGLSGNDLYLDAASLNASFASGRLSLKLDGIDSGFSGYGLQARSLGLATQDLNEIRAYISDVSAEGASDARLFEIPYAEILFNMDGERASVSFPSLRSDYFNQYSHGFLEYAGMENTALTIGFSDGIDAELTSSLTAVLNEPNLEYIAMDVSLSASIASDQDKLSHASASFSNISAGLFSGKGRIDIKVADDVLSADFGFGDCVHGTLSYDESLKGSVSVDGFSLHSLSPVIDAYIPDFSSYIGKDTTLSGSAGFDLIKDDSAFFKASGPVSAGIGIRNITFNEYSFNIGASASGLLKDRIIEINEGAVTTDWLRAGFAGGIDFDNRLPYGDFSLASTASGKHIIDLNLAITGERIYQFSLSTPYLDSVSMAGTLDFSKRNLVSSFADLATGASLHQFGINIDFENKSVSLSNPQMHLYSSWLDTFIFESDFDDFPLMAGSGDLVPCLIDGDLSVSFDFAQQSFEISSPSFRMKNLHYFTGSPDLSFSVHGDNDSISIRNIMVESTGFPDLHGEFVFDMRQFGLLLHLSDGIHDGEQVLLSIIKDGSLFSGILNGKNIRLGRFGQPDMTGSVNLTGSGNTYEDFAFTGDFMASGLDDINDSRRVNSSVFIDSSSVEFSGIKYTSGAVSAGIDSISLDSSAGVLDISGISFMASLEHADRAYPVSFSSSVSMSLPKGDTLYEMARSLIRSRGDGISFSGSVDNVNYDNSLIAPCRTFSGIYSEKKLEFYGDAVSGTINISERTADLDINLMPIAEFRLKADMNGRYGPDYYFDIGSFAVSLANLSISSPILIFYDPAYLHGNLDLIATEEGYRMYGKLDSDHSEFDLFWLPGERIILHNPSFIIWDNVITSNLTDLTCMNLGTNQRVPGKVRLELTFGPLLSFESYEVDVYLEEGNEVNYRLPMPESNIDLTGKVSGHFHIDDVTGIIASSGDLRIKDTVLSVGMNELPSWFGPITAETSTDFNLTLASNCKVIFPLSSTPILTAFAENGTRLFFHNAKDGIRLSGDFNIRSGEIYYFQKYFYITEGKIHFEENQKTLNPVINLRARLRDFDSDGKQVDIYLNLRDSKLNDLNPTFESSPAKSLNEIMQILGQAILPASAYGKSSLTSVASLLTASVDILSRVGLIKGNGTGLDQSIKESLGLDIFSLHSNIVSNILTDTIALSGLGSSVSDFSPMAKYMNGTSIYIGKYILPEVYMQALFHLTAESNPGENRHTFLSDDLVLDSEFSAEWENPLCTVTFFTKPVNLTFYSILDGFGFTLSKRLIF